MRPAPPMPRWEGLSANPSNHEPPTQMVNDAVTFKDSDPGVKEHLHGDGPAAATQRASVRPEADAQPPTGNGEQAPPESLEVNELNEAGADFFFSSPGGPVASGDGIGGTRSTLNLLLVVDEVREDLWKRFRADLKALFAPALLSKQEIYAFLMNDALNRPLLHKADALRFGQRCDNGLAKAKREQAKAKAASYELVRAARKAADANPDLAPGIAEAEEAGAVAFAAALDGTYDVKPPCATVGAKRKAPEPLTVQQECEQARAHHDALSWAMDLAERNLDELIALHGDAPPPKRDLSNARERSLAESEALCQGKVAAAWEALNAALDALDAHMPVVRAKVNAWHERCAGTVEERLARAVDIVRELSEIAERIDGSPPPSPKPLPTASESILQANTCGPPCLLYPDIVPPTDIWVEWDGQEFTSQWMEWGLAREEDGAGWELARLNRDNEASYQLSQRLIDQIERNLDTLGCLETTGCACDKYSL